MSTLANNDTVTPQKVVLRRTYTLNDTFRMCERLNFWGQKHADTGLPLTELVCNEIQRLCTTALLLRTQTIKAGYVLSKGFQQTFARCWVQCYATVCLLLFHGYAERSGQEGDLNVLYARLYILNYNIHNVVRRLCVQAMPIESMTEDTAAQRFQRVETWQRNFLSRFRNRFNPRYVHNYKSLAETPYVLDPMAEAFPGSYGIVQKFNHKGSGEPLAMKTVHRVFSHKEMKKILREIGILEVCNHKNIVRFVQAFRTDDDDQCVRFVMAPWAPYTLSRFLYSPDDKRKEQCPWFQPNSSKSNRCVYRIMYGLADAVDYLHRRHIKHKDLKPDNILLYQEKSEYPTVLVTDVGVSKIYKPGAPTNFRDSTFDYLAPEQHAMKESTFKSDVWQLGCCFAEILAVANKGKSGYEELQDSFLRDDENCQCSIALEYQSFMTIFGAMCNRGDSAQKRAYAVVIGMLELDPRARPSIDVVKVALMKLPGVKTEAANC